MSWEVILCSHDGKGLLLRLSLRPMLFDLPLNFIPSISPYTCFTNWSHSFTPSTLHLCFQEVMRMDEVKVTNGWSEFSEQVTRSTEYVPVYVTNHMPVRCASLHAVYGLLCGSYPVGTMECTVKPCNSFRPVHVWLGTQTQDPTSIVHLKFCSPVRYNCVSCP